MKIKYLFYSLLFITITINAQYETKTISELNLVPDSILTDPSSTIVDLASQYIGDTVKVRGVITFAPLVNWENDRRTTTSAEEYFQGFMQDEEGALWGGLQIIQLDTLAQTGFDIVDTGDVIEVTGIIEEYYDNTTRLQILTDPLTEVNIVDNIGGMPAPIQLSFDDFFDGNNLKKEAEKYESMYVEFQNVITSDRNPTGSTSFAFTDGSGNKIFMYDQSGYFSARTHKLVGLTDYESPADGTLLEHIRGIIHTRDAGWFIVPLYPGDMKEGEIAPATISVSENVKPRLLPSEVGEAMFKIEDNDGTVTEARLFYQVNGGEFTEVDMIDQDTAYYAAIPAVNLDSAFVSFYVYAKDNDGNESFSPSDTSQALHYYWVLKNEPSIFHIQYTPYRGGASRFDQEIVTIQGIVTADSNDIEGGAVQYIQQPGLDKWAGLRMIKVPANGQKRGDLITVTGTVIEDFYHTSLDVINLEVTQADAGEISPLVLSCDKISRGINDAAEEYESMLLQYQNVSVTNDNADGSSNFGEMLVSDGTDNTRVELQDGNHDYHNNWDITLSDSTNLIRINTYNSFESITGVLYYSFSNFKLIPRLNSDFVGFLTDVETNEMIPDNYLLSQNYPNPFNPNTIINYAIPTGNASFVQLKVYDILGREIRTLVNEIKSPGSYEVNFDASDLTTGIYFYTLSTGNFVQTKKMILMK